MNAEELLKSVDKTEEHLARFYPHLLETHSPQTRIPEHALPVTEYSHLDSGDKGGLNLNGSGSADDYGSYRTPNNLEDGSEIQPSSAIQVEANEQNSDILTQYLNTKFQAEKNKLDGQTLVDEAETRIILK